MMRGNLNNSREMLHAQALAAQCQHCSVRRLCFPAGIDDGDLKTLDATVDRRPQLGQGDYLFRAGTAAVGIYVVKSGSMKSSHLLASGDEQIVGLHLPGEVFGLDGFATHEHQLSAQALEATEVCALPFDQLDRILAAVPTLNRQLISMLSREVNDNSAQHVLLGRRSALERVAMFLLRLNQRMVNLGHRDATLYLSVSRQELANYLGLQIETVSRAFSKLKADGAIGVRGRQITILDQALLCASAGLDPVDLEANIAAN